MPTASQPVFSGFWLPWLWRRRRQVRVVECRYQTLVRLKKLALKNRRKYLAYSRRRIDACFSEVLNGSLVGFELLQSRLSILRKILESAIAVEHFCDGEVGHALTLHAVGEVCHLPQ